LFFLYPKEDLIPFYKQGEVMKRTLGWACMAHCLFFTTSLAFVGFQSTIYNCILACWSYSLYLTLNQWQVWLYIIFLGGCITMGIMFGYMASPLIHQKVFLVINMVFYLVVIIFVIKDYIPFAMNGGLYGASGKQKKGSHGKEAKKIFAKACEGLKENE
jgi:hypothetical protein